MRKQIINPATQAASSADFQDWLALENLVKVELTSEDEEHPVESALIANAGPGWRAQQPGEQTIRMLFDKPHAIRHIQLLFEEDERARTQEFVLRWCADGETACREIVRQQYNFSPPDSVRELEDYTVDLDSLTVLELGIVPDISGGDARASLTRLRLAC
jgi:hypothetical protein